MSTTTPTPGKDPTPGPWRVNRHGDAVVSDTAGVTIAEVATTRTDAELIAAAPETAAERDRLQAENAALVAGLHWYAAPETWTPGRRISAMGTHRASLGEDDAGERARAVLAAHDAHTEEKA